MHLLLDHASFVENLLKKDQITSVTLSDIGNHEISQKPGHRACDKSMNTGDRVVYLVGEKPEYGVIKNIRSSHEAAVAEVKFVSKPNL